jgi:hypothetical protein
MAIPIQRRSLSALIVVAGTLFASLLVVCAPARADVTREVPVTMDWRIGYPNVSTCASWGLATWPAQDGAIAWELLYDFNGEERSKTLSPPFGDEEFTKFGWQPAPGTHWYGLSYTGRSSGSGKPVTCDDFPPKQQAFFSNVRMRITVEGPSCSALESRERRLRSRLKTARKGERRARNRLKAAKKQVRVASRRLKKKRATGPRAAALKAEEAKQRAVAAREAKRQVVRDTRKTAQETQETVRDLRTTRIELCPVD